MNVIKSLGRRYVPAWAVHFSDLTPEEQQAELARVPILAETHFDWLLGEWVPRTWTTWSLIRHWEPPLKAAGNSPEVTATGPDGAEYRFCKPIPEPGHWFHNYGRSLKDIGYKASTSENGAINRFGARFDDVDWYITFPSFRAGAITGVFSR